MKIYKYAPMESAIHILNDDRLLLKNPVSFNDPFDNDVKRDKKDIEDVRTIINAFTAITLVAQSSSKPELEKVFKNNPIYPLAKDEYKKLKQSLRLYSRFYGDILLPNIEKLFGPENDVFKEQAKQYLQSFEKEINIGIDETKEQALVTCFSKTYKSILMWSHYAESHTGVCIEYERPDSSDFIDVIYSNQRPKLKIVDAVAFITAKTILGEDFNKDLDKELIPLILNPFITKSLNWQYEEEVRCLTTSSSTSPNYLKIGDESFYKMPKPTKIYIGCRAESKFKTLISKIAKQKNIKIVFLKTDNDTFSLKEK